MARIKGALNARKKHKKVLKLAKGYVGARSKQYRTAKQSVMRAMAASFVGRKQTKREYRRLWIARINAAARSNGISYSRMMNGLKTAGVVVNRKMLAEIAINDSSAFTVLAQKAKQSLEA
ncbi:MAG: 50S ribosomal protein L20 [Clostridiales bacterium]|jgi:large subunit ribosomal protein L20|nr:50S ribosomal protein L20 [Clostridiales bacterium]MDR2750318.1 50S ribosomal protein L20 [Clostridiales bacterium]